MERLEQRPVWSMSGSDMLSALDTLQADLNRINTYRLELLAALDVNGHATEIGARNTIHLIAIRHRLDPTTVRHDLKTAKALTKYEAVNTALHTESTTNSNADTDAGTDADVGAEGDADGGPLVLHPGQAEAIIDALERVPAAANVPVETLRVAEEQMVRAAQLLPPGELRKMGKQVRDRLDTDGPEPAEKRAHARETLWLKRRDDGIQFGGFLAADNAELLQTVIFAGAKPHKTPDGQPDPRTRGKRHADSLVTALTAAAGTGQAAPAHGGIKPHITVTITLADLLAGTGTGDLAFGGTLSAAAIRRLACDAGIIPLVLGANSEPLDVGTEERFVNRAMRRALNARDRGCIVCGAPPAMCEAHHIVHWANGGPTTVENLVLVCKAHHIDIHHGHWTITMHHGRPVLSRPDWATPIPTRTPMPTRTPATPPEPWAANPTRTPTSPDPWAANPGRTPTPPPDPWATSPPDASPTGSPAAQPDDPTDPAKRAAGRHDHATDPATNGTGLHNNSTGLHNNAAGPRDYTAGSRDNAAGSRDEAAWSWDHATGPEPARANPPGQAVHPLGDSAHPLGEAIGQLRRDFADYPDPWAAPPAPTTDVPLPPSPPLPPN